MTDLTFLAKQRFFEGEPEALKEVVEKTLKDAEITGAELSLQRITCREKPELNSIGYAVKVPKEALNDLAFLFADHAEQRTGQSFTTSKSVYGEQCTISLRDTAPSVD